MDETNNSIFQLTQSKIEWKIVAKDFGIKWNFPQSWGDRWQACQHTQAPLDRVVLLQLKSFIQHCFNGND